MKGDIKGCSVYVVCWKAFRHLKFLIQGVYRLEKLTRRMCRLKNPVGVLGISDCLSPPFDLDVAGYLFQEWWSREVMYVEFGLRRHSYEWTEEVGLTWNEKNKYRLEN